MWFVPAYAVVLALLVVLPGIITLLVPTA
jgi:hypothetical protein